MIEISWQELRDFYDSNKPAAELSMLELNDRYHVWAEWHGLKIMCRDLFKDDASEFETTYKNHCNTQRPERVRIVTCQVGRRTHYRYIIFQTAVLNGFDNTNWKNEDYGDITHTMKDVNGNTTTDGSLAVQTILDFSPTFDYEISGGTFDIPSTLGGNQALWEAFVLGGPDIPRAYGGEVEYLANNRLSKTTGKQLIMDESLNPAEITGEVSTLARKIRIIIKHPQGEQAEFQLMFKLYRNW
jgi:hypothetical protein